MMFAVEIDGAIHLDPGVAARDRVRQELLEERHIQFFRWTAHEVEDHPAEVVSELAFALGIELRPTQPFSQTWEKGWG